jgi:O-acetyl-ADP-ribose deacetylase (regulator of RNase III)
VNARFSLKKETRFSPVRLRRYNPFMPSVYSQLPLIIFVLGLFFGFAVLVRRGTVRGKAVLVVGALVSLMAMGAWFVYWLPFVRAGMLGFVVMLMLPMLAASAWSVWTAYKSQTAEDIATHTLGDTKIIVRVCGPRRLPDADALLLPTITSLQMLDGPAATIALAAGVEVQREARKQGPVGMGKIISTGPGLLPVGRILHVAVADPMRPVDDARLRKGMEQAAQQARKSHSESLAVPVGAMRGLTVEQASEATVAGVLKQRKAFAEIVFLAFSAREGKALAGAVEKEVTALEEPAAAGR